jgi:multiple sugar transport system ATP-binding protein
MKDGFIQQVDTPQNLYKYPCNMFVAGFIGSPQMNFVDAEIVEKADGIYVEFKGNSLKLPAEKVNDDVKSYIGKTVVIGIRPEHVHDEERYLEAQPEYIIEADVEVTELMGAETFLYLNVDGAKFTAKVAPTSEAKADDKIKVVLSLEHAHLFDKETQRTIIN